MTKIISVLMLVVVSFYSNAQTGTLLPRNTPEAEGVSSTDILNFINASEKSKNELHSIMVLRHGKVIAEGWWDPYKQSLRHSLYSASKTFTSTAIGFAVSENKLKLSDKVISFFPHDLPDTVSANLAALTVRDVLIMSDGMDPEPRQVIKSKNWVKTFLAYPIAYKPATVFLYISMGTFILSEIIQKVTGQKVVDYLKPHLFDPFGISGVD